MTFGISSHIMMTQHDTIEILLEVVLSPTYQYMSRPDQE